MRTLFLSLALTVLALSANAAKFTGAEAETLVPDAAEVIYLGSSTFPAYLRLSDNKAQPFDRAGSWLGKHFGLDPRITFVIKSSESDRYGGRHVRMQQLYDGYPVRGGQYIFHGRDGKWTTANGKLFLPDSGNSPVLVSADEAVGLALDYLPAEVYGWETEHPMAAYPEAQLTWIAPDLDFEKRGLRLAYAVDVYVVRPLARQVIYLDATTGERIATENRIHSNGVPGTAETRYSGIREINTTTNEAGLFILRDTSRGASILTYDAQRQEELSRVNFTDEDNYWDNVNSNQDEVATDALWSTGKFYDYLLEQGRNSIDGNGETLEAQVHFGQNVANAFWDGDRTYYGDGRPGAVIGNPLTSLEVVGHEFAHGLTNRTADLIYQRESGGLNEGFSDMMGIFLDFRHNPTTGNWRIGSELDDNGQGFRDMEDPRIFGDPRNYEGDNWNANGGVHTNSGVARHWFYTTVTGGDYENDFGETYSFRPMSIDTVMEIEYNALVFYMTPTSTYAEGGLATSIAAANLYGSCSEYPVRVYNVWKALNVDFIPAGGVAANFRLEGPSTICELDVPIQFQNLSVGDTYAWDFGDGSGSTEENPEHAYTEIGTYTVALTVTGCEGISDVFTGTVTVDPFAQVCNAIVFPTEGTVTNSECEGVIFDSGGADDDYGNNERGTVVISNETNSPITLRFLEFNTERTYDILSVYDGPSEDSPSLGELNGNEVPGDITSTNGAITLVFSSDVSVNREGFHLEWSTGSSNTPADAAVNVNNTDVLLGAPVIFTPVAEDGSLSFDFGDGTSVTERGVVTHRYLSSGSFEVTVIDEGCSGRDTSLVTVNVAEGSRYAIDPDSICDTLLIRETAVHPVTISNVGDNPGTLGVGRLGDLTGGETIRIPVSEEEGSAELSFDVPTLLPAVAVTFSTGGDISSFGNIATVFLEGEEIGAVEGDVADGPLTFTLELSGEELNAYTVDGRLDFEIRKGRFVEILSDSYYEITIDYSLAEWATIDGPADSTLAPGDEAVVFVNLASRALAPGTYESTIELYTSDVEEAIVPYPIKLVVVGRPIPAYPDTLIDLGVVYTNQTKTAPLEVNNLGTEVFSVLDIVPGDAQLTTDITDFAVAPYDPVTVSVLFSAPATAGSYSGELTVMTEVGPQRVRILAEVVEPPVATGVPDSLCFVLPSGSVLDTVLTLGNTGVDTLRYTLNKERGERFASSIQEVFETEDVTFHSFEDVPTDEDLLVEVIILGGVTDPDASVYVAFDPGNVEADLPVGNSEAGVPDTVYFRYPRELLSPAGILSVLVAMPPGSFDLNGANLHTVNLYGSVDWLSTPLNENDILSGASFEHAISLDASDLFAGTYRSGLDWTSNDPLLADRCIPVKLIVTGEAVPVASTDSLDFGEVFLGMNRTLPLWIFNRGTAELIVDNLTTDNNRFVVDTTDFTIAPTDSLLVSVTYTAVEPGRDNGELLLSTPGELLRIAMTGVGVELPDPTFSPDTVCVTLMAGATETSPVTVSNGGPGRLDYEPLLTDTTPLPEWLSIDNGSGSLQAGESDNIDFIFDASGLAGGVYFFSVPFLVNNPVDSQRIVVAKLIVPRAPAAAFAPSPLLSCTGMVSFTDQSAFLPTSWVWNFGDGNSSAQQNPVHTYSASGSYTVTLEACNALGCDTFTLPTPVTVVLEEDFCEGTSFVDDEELEITGCGGRIYDQGGPDENYDDLVNSSLLLTSGNGGPLKLAVQSFILEACCDFLTIYDGADATAPLIGSYNGSELEPGAEIFSTGRQLFLTFTTDSGVNRTGFEIIWSCVEGNNGVSISAENQEECPATVSLSPSRIDADMTYSWDFGDGTTGMGAGPLEHTYAAFGDYLVRLVMTRGEETFRAQETVRVDELNFDVSIDLPEEQLVTETEYTFTVRSDVDLDDYFWVLSDGTTSDDGTFTITFATSATYTLYLTARGDGLCEGAAREVFFVELIDNIEERAAEIGMRMYPNPTAGDFTLEVGVPLEHGYHYEVHNPLGQLVQDGPVTGERTTIATRKLTSGAYLLRLLDSNGQLLGGGRFIKQ